MLLHLEVRKRLLAKKDASLTTESTLQEMFNTDARQVGRIGALIENMLDISRLNAKKLHLNRQECDLGELAQNTLERFALNLKAAGCKLSVKIEPNISGHWDPFRLEQVIENFLTNAMKYGKDGPIDVSAYIHKNAARLEVKDSGIGIDPADQERIFMPFERAVSRQVFSGLGLGLFIANEIVKMHGGKVEVRSELGKGASFTMDLPL